MHQPHTSQYVHHKNGHSFYLIYVNEIAEEGETGTDRTGLYFHGSLVATEELLQPAIDRLNQLSTRKSMFFNDSAPELMGGGTDSFPAYPDSDLLDGQFWYNTETSILSIRDSGEWVGVVNEQAVKDIIDSGYVQARVAPGTIIAGGRFNYSTSFAYDSAGVMPGRYVKNQWGVSNIVRDQAGRYTITFDSAVDTALDDSYSYVVTAVVDYKGDNPSLSSRAVAVNTQNASSFSLVAERTDGGTDGDYNNNSYINFTVIKAS